MTSIREAASTSPARSPGAETGTAVGAGAGPPPFTPPAGHPRFPGLDGVRALAACAILALHASEFSGAEQARWWGPLADRLAIGVPVFFVVSGFVLYRPFLAGHAGLAPAPRLRRYVRGRVLRIVPAYWVAMTVLALYPGLPGVFGGDWWRYYGFVQLYERRTLPLGLPPAWTLGAEVAFYAALPLLALLAARRPLSRGGGGPLRVHVAVLLLLIAASTALRVAAIRVAPDSTLTIWPPSLVGWFAGGMLLATASVQRQADGHAVDRGAGGAAAATACWCAAALAMIGLAFLLPRQLFPPHEPVGRFVLENVAYIAIAGLVVAPAVGVLGRGGLPGRVLRLRWLGRLGLISYGIYLWHYPIVTTLADHGVGDSGGLGALELAAAALGLAGAAATASYVLVERPALRLR
jgi:peptidoglycan/LPS O-acetylase OafA/YrhL